MSKSTQTQITVYLGLYQIECIITTQAKLNCKLSTVYYKYHLSFCIFHLNTWRFQVCRNNMLLIACTYLRVILHCYIKYLKALGTYYLILVVSESADIVIARFSCIMLVYRKQALNLKLWGLFISEKIYIFVYIHKYTYMCVIMYVLSKKEA